MTPKEKARRSGPIPNTVLADGSEPNGSTPKTQAEFASPLTVRFDYSCLASADEAKLRQQARRLRDLISKTTSDMIEIGGELASIKDRLDHGQFIAWIEAEIGISVRTAQNYMRLAMLAKGKNETVALLPPSTARMLAAKSAPSEVVRHVLDRVASGDLMSDRAVKELLDDSLHEQRQEAAAMARAARSARKPKSVREREERQRLEALAERERQRAETTVRAQSIIDRFSSADVQFLKETLTWEVFGEFHRLCEGSA